MNEAQRIRTALLASLSLREFSADDQLRLVELTLGGLDDERRTLLAQEIADRLVQLGVLDRVDRFQRDNVRYSRYRVRGGEESFVLPTAEPIRDLGEPLARASRPHWHARSRLLYRSLSHLISVERKLFTRDERNAEYLQTDAGDILRTILASARQILECDDARLYPLTRTLEEPRTMEPVSEGDPWNRALAESWVGRRGLPLYVGDVEEGGRVHAMIDAEAMDATMHVAVAPSTRDPIPPGTALARRARVGDPARPALRARGLSAEPGFFTDERVGILGVVAELATDLLNTLKKLGMLVMIDELTGVYNRPYFGRQLDHEIARAYRDGRPHVARDRRHRRLQERERHLRLRGREHRAARAVPDAVLEPAPFDTVARWGGEEFAIILSAETTRHEAREICERLRIKVQSMAILVPGLDGRENSVRLTMSLGGSMFPADVPLNVDRSRGLDRPSRTSWRTICGRGPI